MQASNDQRIRERAYQIWEDEGHPDGRDQDHWQRAREELAIDEDETHGGLAKPGADTFTGTGVTEPDAMNDGAPAGSADSNQRGRISH